MALRQAQLVSNLSRAVTLASVRCSHHGHGHAVEKFDFGGEMSQNFKDEHYPKIGKLLDSFLSGNSRCTLLSC